MAYNNPDMGTSKSAGPAPDTTPLSDPLYLPNPAVQLWERRLKSMYGDARRRHEDVLQVSDDIERTLGEQLGAAQRDWNSRLYVLMCAGLLCEVLVACLTFGLLFRSLRHLSIQIDAAASDWRFWVRYPEFLVGFLVCAFFAISLAVAPSRLAKRKKPLKGNNSTYFYLDTDHKVIRWYRAAVTYSLAPILLMAFAATTRHPAWIPYSFVSLWLGIPIAGVSAVAIFRTIIRLIKVRQIDPTTRSAARSILSFELLSLLERLDAVANAASLTRDVRRYLLDGIRKVSWRLANLHEWSPYPDSEWAKAQMKLAGENALRLATWVYFPQPGTLVELRKQVVTYLNIALSGELHRFPRSRAEEDGIRFKEPTPSRWRRLAFWGGSAAYLIVPLLAFGLAENFRGFKIPSPIQSLVGLLYLLWAMLGLLAVSERVPPEARAMVMDAVKVVAARK
jgi:hypothetical protein